VTARVGFNGLNKARLKCGPPRYRFGTAKSRKSPPQESEHPGQFHNFTAAGIQYREAQKFLCAPAGGPLSINVAIEYRSAEGQYDRLPLRPNVLSCARNTERN
jgi:hypothetical protein